MANVVKIKKGLNINLKGKAPLEYVHAEAADSYAIVPDNYVGIVPKVLVRTGDKVKAGSPLMMDKVYPEIKFVSPVSGEVTAVNRGEKRKVLSIIVRPDAQNKFETFDIKDLTSYNVEGLKALLLETGLWPCIKQRPYDRVAFPSDTPRDIFVTAYDTAPLAPDFDFIVQGEEDLLQSGLQALTKLTQGTVYLGVKPGSPLRSIDRKSVV